MLLREIIKEAIRDVLIGGLADKETIASIADKHGVPEQKILDELNMGIEVEMEHTNDYNIAIEIALDHLTEFHDYYTRLKRMESWGN